MSRSRKKPAGSRCLCRPGAHKWWKKKENRRFRRKPVAEEIDHPKKVSDIWQSPSDGKIHMFNVKKDEKDDYYRKFCRK